MRNYKYKKQAGALQEAAPMPPPPPPMPMPMRQQAFSGNAAPFNAFNEPLDDYASAHQTGEFALSDLRRLAGEASVHAQTPMSQTQTFSLGDVEEHTGRMTRTRRAPESSLDNQLRYSGVRSMFFYTIEEGQKVLVVHKNGKLELVDGPKKIRRSGKRFRHLEHHVAHPGEFLIVRHKDGGQEHLRGPIDLWLDPRKHLSIQKEECFQIGDREAVVVYSKSEVEKEDADGVKKTVARRIVKGPEDFVPEPGEWLHTFSWHGSKRHPDGSVQKLPNGLVFQKLWQLPDQMYHDIPEVRTKDGAVLTIRLMIFFELEDIETMLVTTHDPIGDFVNAATSDVVEFLSRHDFEAFKANIKKLNDETTYEQLLARAKQCGYKINKVVYRGYGAPAALQQMHDQALESRTRLQLEKATEEQAQQLQDYKLDQRLGREAKERTGEQKKQEQGLELSAARASAEIKDARERWKFQREQNKADVEQQLALAEAEERVRLEKLKQLHALGVDLTAYLTQGRADRVIELRGESNAPHVHLGNESTRK